MKYFFVYICLAALLQLSSSCSFNSGNRYQRYTDFLNNQPLSLLEEMPSDRVFLRYPYRVEIKDSLAIILDLHPDCYYLHAFSYPDWKYVTSFGRRGEGPEEVLSAERIRICSSDSVWVLDSNRSQITRWCISVSSGSASTKIYSLVKQQGIEETDK